ncbi:hypothetical protein [Pendulispora albinea]|uniref:HAF family extracellular repeat protein n=1 Tax=Pendulispora albinea TaxID=2741071 RepID=A0ABZ2LWF1_9BACT
MMFQKAKYFVGVSAVLGVASESVPMRMTDLGALDGNVCTAEGVNDDGGVVGSCRTGSGELVATYWAPNAAPAVLAPLEVGRSCDAHGINAAGVAIGSCALGSGGGSSESGESAAVRWASLPAGLPQRLNPVYLDAQAHAARINAHGTVAGSSIAKDGAARPVIWTTGAVTPTVLSDLSPQGTSCRIDDMTDEEEPTLVGVCNLGHGGSVAVRWTPSPSYPITELSPFEGGSNCTATAIDAQRRIAGTCETADGKRAAVRWRADGTGMAVLYGVGEAGERQRLEVTGMNDAGVVVGNYTTDAGLVRAFVWVPSDDAEKERALDLGALGAGWTHAWRIGNDGIVAGTAQNARGDQEAFVWTAETALTGLGHLGGASSTVTAMSDRGRIAGVSKTRDGGTHVFLITEGGPSRPPAGCERARALGAY